MHIDKDLVAASATPLVLAILTEGESYGYAILKRVRELSEGEMEWTDGMLYPLLHRLRRLGYVTQEWRTPPEGRRRKYYAITDEGLAALEEHKRQWVAVTRVLGDVWGGDDLLSFAPAASVTPRPEGRLGTVARTLRNAWHGAAPSPVAFGRA